MTAMACASDGLGYWLVAEDGGLFCYGTARYPQAHTAWMATPHGAIVAAYIDEGDMVLVEANARSHRIAL